MADESDKMSEEALRNELKRLKAELDDMKDEMDEANAESIARGEGPLFGTRIQYGTPKELAHKRGLTLEQDEGWMREHVVRGMWRQLAAIGIAGVIAILSGGWVLLTVLIDWEMTNELSDGDVVGNAVAQHLVSNIELFQEAERVVEEEFKKYLENVDNWDEYIREGAEEVVDDVLSEEGIIGALSSPLAERFYEEDSAAGRVAVLEAMRVFGTEQALRDLQLEVLYDYANGEGSPEVTIAALETYRHPNLRDEEDVEEVDCEGRREARPRDCHALLDVVKAAQRDTIPEEVWSAYRKFVESPVSSSCLCAITDEIDNGEKP